MNNTNLTHSPPPLQQLTALVGDFSSEPFVTAEQASVALNMPLYYFINTRKRASLGIPYYAINRMVRYRLRELHKWQVGYAAVQAELARAPESKPATQLGGTHA